MPVAVHDFTIFIARVMMDRTFVPKDDVGIGHGLGGQHVGRQVFGAHFSPVVVRDPKILLGKRFLVPGQAAGRKWNKLISRLISLPVL